MNKDVSYLSRVYINDATDNEYGEMFQEELSNLLEDAAACVQIPELLPAEMKSTDKIIVCGFLA
ncbi:MAG: hypothetical protein ACRCU6_12585 [Fusobacteriaceae bacterium]